MEPKLDYQAGQSHLDQEEIAGLKIAGIKDWSEILTSESKSIAKVVIWTEKNQFTTEKIFTELFIREIHKRMFGDVWQWAGKYRLSNKTMGVEKSLISKELKQLFNNIKFWIESESYNADEITIRFIHRLMQIQCFPDGNARHAKLMADIVIENVFNGDIFTWGESLDDPKLQREKLLDALKKADKGRMEDLVKLARL